MSIEKVEVPAFLLDTNDAGVDENDMQNLDDLIRQYDSAAEKVEKAEQILKLYKKDFNELSLTLIPQFLLSHGISKMSLVDGREVTIKEDISATVSDEPAFRKWLRDRKEEAIIKVKYIFGQMKDNEMTKLTDFLFTGDYEFEIDESIHAQTKKKYFKGLIAEIGRDNLPEFVGIYDIRKTIIKIKK
jgi:hypothetical protein